MGELSVRIVVPMDMKKLSHISSLPLLHPEIFVASSSPECGRRSQHVLAQRPHHAVGAGAVSNDICCAEDEADDEADGCHCSVHVHTIGPGPTYCRPS